MHTYRLSAYMRQIKASKLHNEPTGDSLATLKHYVLANLVYCLGMAGRPRARTAIVDAVLPAAALAELDVNGRTLHELCRDAEGILRWLAQYGLIHNSLHCDRCDIDMSLQSREGAFDGYCWACRHCKRRRSVTCDSFFAGAHLSLIQLVDCIYWWSRQVKQSDACVESGVCVKAMIDWQNFIRDVCCQYLLDHPVQMGGPGRTVKVDERVAS